MPPAPPDDDARSAPRLLALVRAHASDAVAFQGLAASMKVWFDTQGAVAYFDTGGAWVAAGGPVSPPDARGEIARRFVDAARQAGRRALFFAVEDLAGFAGWTTLHVGEQPSTSPEEWAVAVGHARTLREQLRRARAKGVRATRTPASDLLETSPMRPRVDALLARWVASRRIEPMAFLVTPDPYRFPEEHAYVVATRGDAVVGLLSAVPAYGGGGWLVEHLVCARDSPNGTAETLLDALYRSLLEGARGGDRVTLGLAPLSGDPATWQRVARALARPLFDFDGLRRFKARLRPSGWCAVWLVAPAGESRVVAIVDSLTAFAGGSIPRFAARSLLLHARGFLWLLAVGLVPWILLLSWLDLTGRAGDLGYSAHALAGWIAFDVLLAVGLFRTALRPAYEGLVALIVAALGDAVLSSFHVAAIGLGPTHVDSAVRIGAAIPPWIGAGVLSLITVEHARERARSRTGAGAPAAAQ